MIDLPAQAEETLEWSWEQWEPAFSAVETAHLDGATVTGWLGAWSRLSALLQEAIARLSVATTCDTSDSAAEARYHAFLRDVYPHALAAEQRLKQRLLDTGLEPEGLSIALRDMRAEAALFRVANLPLLSEERRIGNVYNKLIGEQTVEWAGTELTVPALTPLLQSPERSTRERAWRLAAERQLADRAALNTIWRELLALRLSLAANAAMPDYRAYAWKLRGRFDYTPDDCLRFHEGIAAAVVPAANRVYARRAARLGLVSLRPWDVEAQAEGEAPLRPASNPAAFVAAAEEALGRVDEELGGHFSAMRAEGLLDLENRKGKAPGGYCATFPVARRPFIFMNAVGVSGDVRTLLHEAGHAFHVFETADLPYLQQRRAPIEFAEVAAMSMELLAAPYLRRRDGSYYEDADYVRARVEHLEHIILFWPYMAVVDGFQHWVYTNPQAADEPAACDTAWDTLWARFMGGVDWSGLDDVRVTGWQRKQHIYRYPFYYVEYGMAQLGAVQIWRNSLAGQADAVARYRLALRLGGTRTLPELFAAAGARFAFDSDTVAAAVDLIEEQIAHIEQGAG